MDKINDYKLTLGLPARVVRSSSVTTVGIETYKPVGTEFDDCTPFPGQAGKMTKVLLTGESPLKERSRRHGGVWAVVGLWLQRANMADRRLRLHRGYVGTFLHFCADDTRASSD